MPKMAAASFMSTGCSVAIISSLMISRTSSFRFCLLRRRTTSLAIFIESVQFIRFRYFVVSFRLRRSASVASDATPMKFQTVGLPSAPSVKVTRERMPRMIVIVAFMVMRF